MLFTFVIEGNLIAAPSRSTSPNGTPFTSLKMVHNNRYKNSQGQWVDGKKLFLEVICYRELGTRAGPSPIIDEKWPANCELICRDDRI